MRQAAAEPVQTERLIYEPLRLDHEEELRRLMLNPRVYPSVWPTKEAPTPADVLASLESKVRHWERCGFGLWMLRDRRTGAMVGRGGLQHTYVEGRHEVEAGWAVVPERWGQGLATELAQTSVRVAFEELGLPLVVAFTLVENRASRRVMEKAGFEFEQEIVRLALPHVLYCRRRC